MKNAKPSFRLNPELVDKLFLPTDTDSFNGDKHVQKQEETTEPVAPVNQLDNPGQISSDVPDIPSEESGGKVVDFATATEQSPEAAEVPVVRDGEQLAAELEQELSLPFALSFLLTYFSTIDFETRAGRKLLLKHYVYYVVHEVLQTAKRQGVHLYRSQGSYYVYNSEFYEALDEKNVLKPFLSLAAIKMSIDPSDARNFKFTDHLLKQFEAMVPPAPVPDPEGICINLQNGIFFIGSGRHELLPHSTGHFLNYQLPFAYQPNATAPLFHTFLGRVLPDEALQQVLAEYLGYCLTRSLKLEKVLILFGSGANGKSVVFEIVCALLGAYNVSNYSLQSLTDKSGYYRARLSNKLVNYASEISGQIGLAAFKQLASGEPLEARLPYGQPFILHQYAKLLFNANELPKDVEITDAFFRRFLIIPFLQTIPEEQQDKELAQKIISRELPGIFNWVLEGLQRLLEQGDFTSSSAARDMVEQYKLQTDSVRLFLPERNYSPHITQWIAIKELYEKYREFCSEDGYRPVNKINFKKRLSSYGVAMERKSVGDVAFVQQFIPS